MTYHTDTTALTRSMLVEFSKSPEVFKSIYIDRTRPPKKPTSQMEVGTVAHSILLDGNRIEDAAKVYPTSCLKVNGTINPKPAREFEIAIQPATALKKDAYEAVCSVVDAARKSFLGEAIRLSTATEQVREEPVSGRLCKCKPDIYGVLEDRVSIWDLKIGVIDDGLFRRNAKRFKLWMQDAHYSAILEQRYGLPVEFRFCVIEPQPPFRVRAYWYDDDSREKSRVEHARLIEHFVACEASGEWSDNHNPILTLSPWDVNTPDIDFEGIDDA